MSTEPKEPVTIPAPPPAGAPEHEFEQHEDADARISGVWDEPTPPSPKRLPPHSDQRPKRNDPKAFRSLVMVIKSRDSWY